MIKTINLTQDKEVVFDFILDEEKASSTKLGSPQKFLYEPNAAILKSGGFKIVGEKYGLSKLHQHSHLYTSETLVDFPGRKFSIIQVLPYSKKTLRSFSQTKANITTRNFPLSVAELRKKHKIKDGGDCYLFFTKNHDDSLVVLDCSKELD
jgi:hypothetical protein